MTWNVHDLPKDARPRDDATAPPPAESALPRQRLLARWHETTAPELPMDLRRAMWDLGLVDEATWAEHRRLLTRGIPET